MSQYPDLNDRTYNLWKKTAQNIYDFATNFGVAGLNAPNWNDTQEVLMKKTDYYLAALADRHTP